MYKSFFEGWVAFGKEDQHLFWYDFKRFEFFLSKAKKKCLFLSIIENHALSFSVTFRYSIEFLATASNGVDRREA